MSDYSLILAFNRGSEDFCLGFEAGTVYLEAGRLAAGEQLHADDEPGTMSKTVHAANAEMVLRIAEAHGLAVRSAELGSGWLDVTFSVTPDTEAAP